MSEEKSWCFASIEDVKNNILKIGYPIDKIHFVKGKIENTVPKNIPNSISFLRLDTDWYESTMHELNHLYPLVTKHGAVLIDDYGHWQGCREAVDEYFNEKRFFLHRSDYTGRSFIKID